MAQQLNDAPNTNAEIAKVSHVDDSSHQGVFNYESMRVSERGTASLLLVNGVCRAAGKTVVLGERRAGTDLSIRSLTVIERPSGVNGSEFAVSTGASWDAAAGFISQMRDAARDRDADAQIRPCPDRRRDPDFEAWRKRPGGIIGRIVLDEYSIPPTFDTDTLSSSAADQSAPLTPGSWTAIQGCGRATAPLADIPSTERSVDALHDPTHDAAAPALSAAARPCARVDTQF